MPWGRVDDTYYDHPKLEQLQEIHEWPDRLVAAGLNAIAWSWCNRFLTDGHVPRNAVTRLGGTVELADMLVGIGLWEQAHNGYQIHDFLVYNDSREQVLARRAAEARRKADWRAKRRPTGTDGGTGADDEHDVPPGVTASVPPGHSPADTSDDEMSRRPSRPPAGAIARIPTRPDPSRTRESSHGESHQPRETHDRATLLTKRQLAAWATFGSEWDDVKAAWLERGFRHPPAGSADDETSQRALLYEILDARPGDLVSWIREAPTKLPSDKVVAHVLGRWKAVKAEVDAEPDDEHVPWLRGGPEARRSAAETVGAIAARVVGGG